VRHHHERYEGGGYPDGLVGDKIPLLARILGVADAFDAMHSPRPHRPALPGTEVDRIFTEGAGRQWDPRIVDHLMLNGPHFHALCRSSATPPEISPVQQVVQAWDAHSSAVG
jgi:HD-GYP domain-containing protein (c-di-GMP phosphodiesterase class II)